MLDYTKAALSHVKTTFKKIDYARNLITQSVYILYLFYALFSGAGVRIANAILLILSLAYLGFFLYVTAYKVGKTVKRTVKTIFRRCKLLIRFFTLGVMIYGICVTVNDVNAFSVLLSVFMAVGWILQILFEIISTFLLKQANYFVEALEADFEPLTKPVKKVSNFFKKMTGKEVDEEESVQEKPSATRVFLDKKVAESKTERRIKLEMARKQKAEKRPTKTKKIKIQQIPAPSEEDLGIEYFNPDEEV